MCWSSYCWNECHQPRLLQSSRHICNLFFVSSSLCFSRHTPRFFRCNDHPFHSHHSGNRQCRHPQYTSVYPSPTRDHPASFIVMVIVRHCPPSVQSLVCGSMSQNWSSIRIIKHELSFVTFLVFVYIPSSPTIVHHSVVIMSVIICLRSSIANCDSSYLIMQPFLIHHDRSSSVIGHHFIFHLLHVLSIVFFIVLVHRILILGIMIVVRMVA